MIELFVAIAVVAVLAAAAGGVYQGALAKGKMMKEVGAAQSLIKAYHLYASENNGQFMAAFDPYARDISNVDGKPITMKAIAERYPFRLAPYFGSQLKGTILVNNNEQQIKKTMMGMMDYGISAFPVLGINRFLVGGVVTSANGAVQFPSDCITRSAQADASVIAFASGGTTEVDGYEYVKPPFTTAREWSSMPWKKDADPGNYGNVDARYDGKAVCAFLDGSVKMLSIDDLRDMRLWSRNAKLQDNKEYTLPREF